MNQKGQITIRKRYCERKYWFNKSDIRIPNTFLYLEKQDILHSLNIILYKITTYVFIWKTGHNVFLLHTNLHILLTYKYTDPAYTEPYRYCLQITSQILLTQNHTDTAHRQLHGSCLLDWLSTCALSGKQKLQYF